MSFERVESFVILRIADAGGSDCYRLLAEVLDLPGPNCWKISSGIISIASYGGLMVFQCSSGSEYHCFSDTQGLSAITRPVYKRLLAEHYNRKAELIQLSEFLSIHNVNN